MPKGVACFVIRLSRGQVLGSDYLVPLYPETYAMTFPRGGIVRLRARALVPLYPETYAMTFPRGGIVRLRARALVPLYPETYPMTFPRGGIVRFAHWHWSSFTLRPIP